VEDTSEVVVVSLSSLGHVRVGVEVEEGNTDFPYAAAADMPHQDVATALVCTAVELVAEDMMVVDAVLVVAGMMGDVD